MEKVTTQLRKLLAGPGCVVAPGVADGLAARLVKLAGFDAVYMTGFGTSITRLGMPDRLIAHATRAQQLAEVGLDVAGIVASVRDAVRKSAARAEVVQEA